LVSYGETSARWLVFGLLYQPRMIDEDDELGVVGGMSGKQTPWPLVRKRTIPTERPPLVDKILVSTFVDRGVSRGQRGGSPTAVNLSFLDRSRHFSFK
jgi:hypothetical protein